MNGESGRLVPLREASGLRIAPDMPDVRGWDVVGADGAVLGRVAELLVDPDEGRVRYLELETGSTADGGRRVHVPIGLARLDEARDVVVVPTVTTAVVGELTTLDDRGITRDYELQVRRRILGAEDVGAVSGAGAADAADAADATDDARFYAGEHFDERRFAAPRRREERGEHVDEEEDDFGYLAGVGGAMTEEDEHPEVVGELDAGQISLPVMEEESDERVASDDRRG